MSVQKLELAEDVMTCWCGETKPYFAPRERDCGGLGTIQCLCGGDQCVCHHHGEYECPGCDECADQDDTFEE